MIQSSTFSVCLRSISRRSMCFKTSSFRGSIGSGLAGRKDSCISFSNSASEPAIVIQRWQTISATVIRRAGSIVSIRFISSSHSEKKQHQKFSVKLHLRHKQTDMRTYRHIHLFVFLSAVSVRGVLPLQNDLCYVEWGIELYSLIPLVRRVHTTGRRSVEI